MPELYQILKAWEAVALNKCSVMAAIWQWRRLWFVARRGKDRNYVMGHSRCTSGPGAARWLGLTVLWLMQYWSKELWVVDICIR